MAKGLASNSAVARIIVVRFIRHSFLVGAQKIEIRLLTVKRAIKTALEHATIGAMNSTIRIGLVQHSCTEDRGINLAVTLAGIREAAGKGARLILLQELHTGVYFCQAENTKRFDLAETIPSPTTQEL